MCWAGLLSWLAAGGEADGPEIHPLLELASLTTTAALDLSRHARTPVMYEDRSLVDLADRQQSPSRRVCRRVRSPGCCRSAIPTASFILPAAELVPPASMAHPTGFRAPDALSDQG